MYKKNKKIITFILAITFLGYGLIGFGFSNTNTVFAYNSLSVDNAQIQEQETGCSQDSGNCTQERANDCNECAVHNGCHSNYLLILSIKVCFSDTQKAFFPKNDDKFNNLNDPPESPPS